MNTTFIVAFMLLAKYNFKACFLCLASLCSFYYVSDDFAANIISCAIMGAGVFVLKGFTMRLLFFVACGLNLLSALSNYYFDYSGLNIKQLHDMSYYVYFHFTSVAITINALIIMDIIRTNRARIAVDISMLIGVLGCGYRIIFNRQNAKGAEKG